MLNQIDYSLQSVFKIGKDGSLLWFPNILWGKGYVVADKEKLEKVLGYLYVTVPMRAQLAAIVLLCFVVVSLFFKNYPILITAGLAAMAFIDLSVFCVYRNLYNGIVQGLARSDEKYGFNDFLMFLAKNPKMNCNGFAFWTLAIGLSVLSFFMGCDFLTDHSLKSLFVSFFFLAILCLMFCVRKMWVILRKMGV